MYHNDILDCDISSIHQHDPQSDLRLAAAHLFIKPTSHHHRDVEVSFNRMIPFSKTVHFPWTSWALQKKKKKKICVYWWLLYKILQSQLPPFLSTYIAPNYINIQSFQNKNKAWWQANAPFTMLCTDSTNIYSHVRSCTRSSHTVHYPKTFLWFRFVASCVF